MRTTSRVFMAGRKVWKLVLPIDDLIEMGERARSSADDRENARVGYQAAVNAWTYSSELLWAKSTAMLVANSIVIASIALIVDKFRELPFLAWPLPILGLIICVVWLMIWMCDIQYTRYLLFSARELEELHLSPKVKTLSRGATFVACEPVTLVIGGNKIEFQMSENRVLKWFLHWRRFQYNPYWIISAFLAVYVLVIVQMLWLYLVS